MSTTTRRYGGRHGYGYSLDPEGHQVTSIRVGSARLGSDPPPAQVDWSSFLIETAFDQGAMSSCFPHGESGVIYGAFGLAGRPLSFIPSPKSIWDVCRCIDRAPNADGQLPKLTDTGVMANQGIRGLGEWGIVPIGAQALDGRFSDINPARQPGDEDMSYVALDDEPFMIDLETADECRIEGPYRIDSVLKAEIVADTVSCLSNRVLVALAMFVDRKVEDWRPSMGALGRPDFADPEGGWHWVFLYGYRRMTNGRYVFLWRNSWGDWGDHGNGLGDEDFLAATADRYAHMVRRTA